ncbi:MAG: GAF domain-containing protein [Burkholderiaceae bacterium]
MAPSSATTHPPPPWPGWAWTCSEAAVGTTAIGTTLAEQQPVWLHRGEHFFRDTAIFSCAGAPIFGPDGRCVGMLDLTGVNVVEQPALKHLVRTIGPQHRECAHAGPTTASCCG